MIFWVGLHNNHTEIELAEANMCPKSNSNIKSYSYLQNNTQKPFLIWNFNTVVTFVRRL